jgi:hypothetical protein
MIYFDCIPKESQAPWVRCFLRDPEQDRGDDAVLASKKGYFCLGI